MSSESSQFCRLPICADCKTPSSISLNRFSRLSRSPSRVFCRAHVIEARFPFKVCPPKIVLSLNTSLSRGPGLQHIDMIEHLHQAVRQLIQRWFMSANKWNFKSRQKCTRFILYYQIHIYLVLNFWSTFWVVVKMACMSATVVSHHCMASDSALVMSCRKCRYSTTSFFNRWLR